MRFSPQILIGASAVMAMVVLGLYFYQTSPEKTDQVPQSVVVVNESPETSSGSDDDQDQTAKETAEAVEDTEVAENQDEASLTAEGFGINLARVRPDGSAIIAGTAAPGSVVNLMKDGQVMGSAVTTEQGEWVILPETLLGQGAHLLSIEIINPDGSTQIGDMALAIEIINSSETPLVALVPYTEDAATTAQILQAPEVVEPTETSQSQADTIAQEDTSVTTVAIVPRVTIRSIQALNPKTLSISGNAEGGASIDLLINGVSSGQAKPDADAMYAVMAAINPDKSNFMLKSILRDASGEALASATINLSKAQIAEGIDGNALVVIQKGDALWRIAYKTYGAGIRYVDIVRQNPTKINDPDLIYPDQIFVIPNG